MGYVADFLSYSSIVVNETTVIPMSYSAREGCCQNINAKEKDNYCG